MLLVAIAVAYLHWSVVHKGIWVDIDVYIQGGQAILDGRSPYGISVHGLPFTYTPFAAVMFAPLAAVPTQVARYLVTGLSVTAYGASGAIVGRRLGLPLERALPVLVLGLALEPFTRTVLLGQVNSLLMLGVVVDCLVLTRRRGWLTGFATGIKLTPGVFILYFALKRDWGALRGAVLGFLVTASVGTLVLPGASWSYWTGGFARLSQFGDVATAGDDNQSLYAALVRGLGPLPPPRASSAALVLLGVALGVWLARRAVQAGDDVTAVVVLAVGGLLASPIAWTHHWVWILPAMLVLLAQGRLWWLGGYAVLFFLGPTLGREPTRLDLATAGLGARALSVAYVFAGILWLVLASRPPHRAQRRHQVVAEPDGPAVATGTVHLADSPTRVTQG